MRTVAFALATSLCLAGYASAQTPAPVAPTPAPVVAPAPAPDVTTAGKISAKAARKECRASVKSEGLKGDERRKAVSDCFIKQRPDLAAKEKARQDCFTEAKTKGLDKDARKSFIKDCAKTKS